VDGSLGAACFIYPEVSANVQGFVRSRVSSPGIYLFSDTGAGTVDQSVFIFMHRNEDQSEHLTYLHGSVFPLGSSQIEQKAASISGSADWSSLEKWREKKEQGDSDRELMYAREWIAESLRAGTQATLAFTKQKLYVKDQLSDIKVIFGGGGHCEHPYKTAVMKTFSGQLFRKAITPGVVGLPVPHDLELNGSETRWMRRLSVAYGLSFEKSELAGFTYPKDVNNPTPDQIWPRRKEIPDAASKDEYGRCLEVIKALHAKAENYPKGALNVRKKQSKGKEYVYHYLVRRDGKKVINRHISEKELPELQKLIEEREKCRKEIRAYKKRMAYLEKLLNKPNPREL
jgi:hypothetical protein